MTKIEKIDWANLSDDDKQVVFAWLDEVFAPILVHPHPPPHLPVTIPIAAGTPYTTSAPVPRSPPRPPPPRASYRTGQNTGLEPPDGPAQLKFHHHKEEPYVVCQPLMTAVVGLIADT